MSRDAYPVAYRTAAARREAKRSFQGPWPMLVPDPLPSITRPDLIRELTKYGLRAGAEYALRGSKVVPYLRAITIAYEVARTITEYQNPRPIFSVPDLRAQGWSYTDYGCTNQWAVRRDTYSEGSPGILPDIGCAYSAYPYDTIYLHGVGAQSFGSNIRSFYDGGIRDMGYGLRIYVHGKWSYGYATTVTPWSKTYQVYETVTKTVPTWAYRLDPDSLPVFRYADEFAPIPYRLLPHRRGNPFRVHGSEMGYHVPGEVAEPSIPDVQVDPGKPPVVVPPGHVAAPPGRKTKERKVRLSGAAFRIAVGVGRAAGTVTEGLDLLNALYYAIPAKIRGTKRRGVKNKAKFVYAHVNDIDMADFIRNYALAQAQDKSIGRHGQQMKKLYGSDYYPNRPFGLMVGPAL